METKPSCMKKTFVIILVIQTVLIVFLTMISFTQGVEASRQRDIAYEYELKAIESEKLATELKQRLESCCHQ